MLDFGSSAGPGGVLALGFFIYIILALRPAASHILCLSRGCVNSLALALILCGEMLDTVNRYLETTGIRISTGTIVDATIIHAPSSTKNSSGKRDPEMHQVKKGKQWYFGAKAHIGVDSKDTVVRSVATTAASVADKHMLSDLLHGDKHKVGGDGS